MTLSPNKIIDKIPDGSIFYRVDGLTPSELGVNIRERDDIVKQSFYVDGQKYPIYFKPFTKKICSCCGEVLPVENFYTGKNNCKKCFSKKYFSTPKIHKPKKLHYIENDPESLFAELS